MKVNKKVISNLAKCYSIAPLQMNHKEYFMVAAEKHDRCILFNLDGKEIDTIWEGPGGVMTMVQVPGSNGQFLATHEFYSPNDSGNARIVCVTPDEDGKWKVETLVELPHVHRFGILVRNGSRYLIACTLKSGHNYKEDWSVPGKVYAAVLPENLCGYLKEKKLKLTVLKDSMLKNHGYYQMRDGEVDTAVVSSEEGIFQFIPPEMPGQEWEIRTLLDTPASDAVMVDLDDDGEKELAVLSPFHGDIISIYKKREGQYKKVYQYEEQADFVHAVFAGFCCGKNRLIVGHRKNGRNLISFDWDKENGRYRAEIIDRDCGPANVYHYVKDGKDYLVSANREIDEIALYQLQTDDTNES